MYLTTCPGGLLFGPVCGGGSIASQN